MFLEDVGFLIIAISFAILMSGITFCGVWLSIKYGGEKH